MKKSVIGLGIFLFAMLTPFVSHAGNKEDAVKLVDQAAAFFKAEGREKGLAELNKAGGKFDQGELYVFVYDLKGVMVAHPKNQKLVGQNLLEVPDAEGKLFRKEILEKATSPGTGWVEYMYKNPAKGNIEAKTTYVKKVDDLVFCAGTYR